ncbi:MAG TPA: DUF2382 domain-containing protein [Ktedonobacterales bacterium]|nr:DUF2382 domain-containing protein [Ktedonobacterales bacterium]
MLDNQGLQGNFADQQIMEGTPVYDVNGDKVGEVSDRGLQRKALIVHKGLIFTKDLYVPLSAIRGQDADGVYLNLAKDDIKSQNWDQPPTESTGAAPGFMTNSTATGAASTTTSTANTGATVNDVNIPLREEELVADKQRQQVGDVHLHRDVTQERQTIQAPVTHEEVTIERRPGSDNMSGDDAFTDKDIDVPVMGEQLNVAKEAHVAEEVHLRKDRVTEQQQASDTVRRERLNVDGQPDSLINEADSADYGATDATNAPDNNNPLP